LEGCFGTRGSEFWFPGFGDRLQQWSVKFESVACKPRAEALHDE